MKPDNTMKAVVKDLGCKNRGEKGRIKELENSQCWGEGEGVSPEPGMTRSGEEGELPGRLEQERGLAKGSMELHLSAKFLNPDQCGRQGD